MKYYINEQQIKVNKSIFNRLGKGKEGAIYRFEDKAIKIYKMKKGKICRFPQYIDYEKTLAMSNLKLYRFNKPLDAVVNEHNQLCAHTMDLISGSGNILNMDVDQLLNELNLIEKDVKTLTLAFFRIRDLHIKNIIVNDKINILDCNSYERVNKEIRINNPDELKNDLLHNYNCINKAIIGLLSLEMQKSLFKNRKEIIHDIYHVLWTQLIFSPYYYLGHLFEQEVLDKFDSPKMYIKYKMDND